MSAERVLIIGGRIENVRKAVEQGLGVVYLQQPGQFTPEHAKLVDAAFLVDFADWSVVEPIVTAAHKVYGFTRVATTGEAGVEIAGRINDLLGLGGVSHEVARLLRDKLSMREHLSRVGASTVPAVEVTDRAALEEFGAAHGYPFIVKPVDGIASLGIQLVRGPQEVGAAWDRIVELRASDHQFAQYFPLDRFVAEGYIEGPEFSVEAFTFEGRHVIVAVTEKLTDGNFVEAGHVIPARIDMDAERAVEAAVVEFLDAMGVVHGPTHTELRLSPDGPQVIESHNRPGGDRIRDLVEAAYGFDMEAYTVAWPCPGLPAPTERPPLRQAAATRFLTAEPGVVSRIEGAEEVRALEGVVELDLSVSTGDEVAALRSSWDRIGQVIAVGADPDAALATCEEACARTVVVTGDGRADAEPGTGR
ncbi:MULTISPECIES: ATP-grasp domain-containing protein [unclassified Streptomyces]|uniref:ATP-grasp domain-containing protein n=1 Tax=unclassified Streptomyces TaxID=2593676 RepID=UPI00099D3155|nr:MULTISPECIES: ATP-grasp domain-containing protein [unclassified Streptomyces]